MFLVVLVFVYLVSDQDYSKSYKQIFMKFWDHAGVVIKNKSLHFGVDVATSARAASYRLLAQTQLYDVPEAAFFLVWYGES